MKKYKNKIAYFLKIMFRFSLGIITIDGMCTENGLQHFPVGLNTQNSGRYAPPGKTTFYMYNLYSTQNSLRDNSGRARDLRFNVNQYISAIRVLHTFESQVGPFNVTAGGVIPFRLARTHVGPNDSSHWRMGDAALQAYFSWNNKKNDFSFMWGPVIFMPTGYNKRGDAGSAGLNYWTFVSESGITWSPSKRWEIDLHNIIEFKTKNKKTNYHSGNDTAFTFFAGYQPIKSQRLKVGVQGLYYVQFEDDKIGGAKVENLKGKEAAFGPQVMWSPVKGFGVILKYQHPTYIRNRPKQKRFWLLFMKQF